MQLKIKTLIDFISGEKDKIIQTILNFFFNNSCIYVDRFFSKLKNQPTYIKIFENNKIKSIKFNSNEDHFENMFHEILKNYNKLSFQNYHRQRISNQIKLINTLSSIK